MLTCEAQYVQQNQASEKNKYDQSDYTPPFLRPLSSRENSEKRKRLL